MITEVKLEDRLHAVTADEVQSLPFYNADNINIQAHTNYNKELNDIVPKEYQSSIRAVACTDKKTDTFFKIAVSKKQGVVYILDLNVKSNLQGNGWGRAIVDAIERIALRMCCPYVKIWHDSNPTFWKHIGYNKKKNSLPEKKVS